MKAFEKEREKEVVSQYQAGVATSDLCSDFGVSDTTIRNILRRNGVTPSKSPAQNQLDAVELYDAFRLYLGGMNTHQVGDELGRSLRGVQSGLKRAGIRLRKNVKRKLLNWKQECELAGRYVAGETFSDLESRYSVSSSVVKRVLNDHGVTPRTGWGRYKTEPWTDRNGVEHIFKSSWELAYAKHLDEQGLDWRYEPFKVYLKVCRCYTPDFGVYEDDVLVELVEVKGWLDERTISRLTEFKKRYPQMKLKLVGPMDMVELGLVEAKYLNHPQADIVFRIQQKFTAAA